MCLATAACSASQCGIRARCGPGPGFKQKMGATLDQDEPEGGRIQAAVIRKLQKQACPLVAELSRGHFLPMNPDSPA